MHLDKFTINSKAERIESATRLAVICRCGTNLLKIFKYEETKLETSTTYANDSILRHGN